MCPKEHLSHQGLPSPQASPENAGILSQTQQRHLISVLVDGGIFQCRQKGVLFPRPLQWAKRDQASCWLLESDLIKAMKSLVLVGLLPVGPSGPRDQMKTERFSGKPAAVQRVG